MQHYEKQSRRIGLWATVGIHSLLLLIFLLVAANTPEEEVKLEFGVAVNYGNSNEGFGTLQTYNSANNSTNKENQQAATKQEVTQTQFTDNKVIQQAQNQVVNQEGKNNVLTTDDKESPAVVAKETSKVAVKETTKPEPTPNPQTTLAKGNTEGTDDSKVSQAGGNNNGNKEGTVGDMGKPNGDVNADALLGNGGMGGGTSLEMTGWVWDEKPIVTDNSADTGKIVFEIKIDEDGEVIAVKNIYSTVSRTVANLYEKAIYDLTFSPTTEGIRPAVTIGKITFVIKAK